MISILLAAYKSEELLRKVFIPGFFTCTNQPTELIIYDNGGNGDFFESRKNERWQQGAVGHTLHFIGDGKNIGLNAALNKCAKVAKGEWFYLPHTDMYLMPGWDTALLQAAKNHPPTSLLLCSRSIEPGYSHIPSQIKADYLCRNILNLLKMVL